MGPVACRVALRLAEPIFGLLGRTGIQVLGRVLGLVLAGIAVSFVLNGLRASGSVPRPDAVGLAGGWPACGFGPTNEGGERPVWRPNPFTGFRPERGRRVVQATAP
jgi:hypothetical protein